MIFPTAASGTVLRRAFVLLQSCSSVCMECVDNIPLQSALGQAVNTAAIFALQEDARLLHRRKVAVAKLATLKPIEKVQHTMDSFISISSG